MVSYLKNLSYEAFIFSPVPSSSHDAAALHARAIQCQAASCVMLPDGHETLVVIIMGLWSDKHHIYSAKTLQGELSFRDVWKPIRAI